VIYEVTAFAVNPRTGEVVKNRHTDSRGRRVERVDTITNELFCHCLSEWDIEDQYEAFWNRLNDIWETDFPRHALKVKVLMVRHIN
jgi:hypothetical protein